jgi:hypothetical protein
MIGSRALLNLVGSLRRWIRQRLCPVFSGGHELYPARSPRRLYQCCLLCGYETRGWALEAGPRLRRQLAGRSRPRIVWRPSATGQRRAG